MSKARGGRPSKLTPEVQEKIVTAIRAGNYAQVAAVYAGIGERTFYRWMELGKSRRQLGSASPGRREPAYWVQLPSGITRRSAGNRWAGRASAFAWSNGPAH